MTQLGGMEQYGVLKTVPPRVVAAVSCWVLLADGVFWGMTAYAQRIDPVLCALEGVALTVALVAASDSLLLRLLLGTLAAVIFGTMIFSFCGLVGFAVLVAAQVGLMHYCALAVLGPRIKKLKMRLFA